MRLMIGALAALTVLFGAGACTSSSDGAADDGPESAAETTSSIDVAVSAGALERYEGYTSEVYSDPAHWICRPDNADDVCKRGLETTVVDADGTMTEESWTADPDAPIDCFYVYPTISADTEEVSDLVMGPEEEFVAANQAARLGSQCRVFAPVYRQRTLAGLASAFGAESTTTTTIPATDDEATDGPADSSPGYTDVVDAWKTYMANDNDGRGVVLIGHSQGAAMLNALIQDEIDPFPEVRDRIVGAYLAGWSVIVPEGDDVGGDFQNVPLCSTAEQAGCVTTWASFRSTSPPPEDSIFGRPRGGEGVSACVNPASPEGGTAPAHSYFTAAGGSAILATLGTMDDAAPWVSPDLGTVTTPFVSTPGLVEVECVSRDGFNYLEVTVNGDPNDPRIDDISGDLTPQWGLHLQDVNLVMGDIVDRVADQSATWRAEHG